LLKEGMAREGDLKSRGGRLVRVIPTKISNVDLLLRVNAGTMRREKDADRIAHILCVRGSGERYGSW